MKKIILSFLLISSFVTAQNFTKKDTLLGSNTAYRNFWDVKKYDISIEPNYQLKSIKGSNKISFSITKDAVNPTFQIDLQQPMAINNLSADFEIESKKTEDNFVFIKTKKHFKKGENYTMTIDFEGNPTIAQNAPWDGGWVFARDYRGNPWMSVACEGIGASVWLPIKDMWSDEPDHGATLTIITPKDLVGVGNGKLISQKTEQDKNIFVWEVKNTINSYNIIPYIGKYVRFSDEYQGEKGKLTLDYWVLEPNLEKAKKHFQQVQPMLKSFEYWFGPYPFYEDGYKIVESPYLGMEHQSNIAYGNRYRNGYLGSDLSGTGVGLNWDFIIIHESGHEWFGNSITAKEKADMWIHESFTNYSETLFTESFMDKNSANQYLIGSRKNIKNDIPVIGHYGVAKSGSGDMYYKGASMLHTIRQVMNNDEKFRQILRGLNKDFYHQIVTTKQVEDYINQKSGINFSSLFNQYLRTTDIPQLEYQQKGKQLKFRWNKTVAHFTLPVRLQSHAQSISPTKNWQTITLKDDKEVVFDENYYIDFIKIY
ncbi:MAG: M1 family metallopeptidase [Cloacibacterium sp.]|nr:M1 family metallopeptidase [Cloacibacterium sp.]